MIYLGPAGIPLSSRDRTTAGGIKRVAELKLNSMEVEFVRGVGMSNETANEVGEIAKGLGILLSVHCPYFINLCSQEPKKLEASKRRILDSVERAFHMGAKVAVFHPGFYGKLSPEVAFVAVKEACADMLDRMKARGIKGVKLGLETTGKVSQFGTLDEIIDIYKKLKGCAPVVDFAHINCRTAGSIKTEKDYAEIFDKLRPLHVTHLHTHFSSAQYTPAKLAGQGNERRHLELKANDPPFLPLAREMLRRKLDITIISESPILEQDSLKMREILEHMGHKF